MINMDDIAEVLIELLLGHSDTVIGYCYRLFVLVDLDRYTEILVLK